ncbi:2,3-dihydro-2,3-dihydroxybenzoate dehydrogenase [Actinorhabdospora filicis]|uniref:2,3-dihydro-2,3-dihydroxybenzoate dehydrogenase n=1 Tax=Actinorhabdospora filicis TaxID=1785913 RepID=A0A9W6SSM9_9ACTN|nr:SDR family oxidoreductase [Actinorhabdospora filicis]GLZ81736.1 2,3-dihydro-2,3-dihydroxybenzoate dehydrogenase [Actinorhabdospora filicis]
MSIAVVTGAASGIGAAVAEALAAEGHTVAGIDLDGPYAADVADPLAVTGVIASIEDGLGPVEILVNAAGICRTGPAVDLADADWDALFAVNATGVMRVSREVARRMAPRGRGTIVTVASNAGGIPRAHMAAYAASKAAAAHFTRCLGLELAPRGVRCNVVSPGSTDTPMQRALWAGTGGAAAVIAGDPALFKTGIPLGRLAEPADVAAAVVFLASPAARHITMQDLYVDGGATPR